MSISPDVWGPYGWSLIHYVALGYPEQPTFDIITKYRNFFISLANVIPCEKCKTHYKQMIDKNPPQLHNKDSLFKWTVDIHNIVNKRLNKNIFTLNQAYDKYMNLEQDISKPKKNNNSLWLKAILVISIIILLIITILLITYSSVAYSPPTNPSILS